jgi:squalene cyclase
MSHATPASKLKVFAALGATEHPQARDILKKIKASQGLDGSWGKPAIVNGTAYVLYLLLEAGEPENSKIIANAVKWLFGKQLRDGGWTETVPPPRYVEEVVRTDRSCTWITAHVVQALVKANVREDSRVKLAVEYLKSCQNADGGWPPWKEGESTLSIMDYVVKALVDYGEPTNSPCIRKAVKYILSQKNQWTPFNASAVLPCLLVVGFKPTDEAIRDCLNVLVKAQNEDGGWTYPRKTEESDPGLTAHIVYWLAKCGYRFKLPFLQKS